MTTFGRESEPESGSANLEAWTSELEAMEAYLSAQREAFAYRDVERPSLRAPSALHELGPLPESLRPRAEELPAGQPRLPRRREIVDARASVATALRHADRGRRQRRLRRRTRPDTPPIGQHRSGARHKASLQAFLRERTCGQGLPAVNGPGRARRVCRTRVSAATRRRDVQEVVTVSPSCTRRANDDVRTGPEASLW